MEKIITITQNSKTYSPSQVSKQTFIVDSVIAYSPSLTEKIIATAFDGFLLSNLDKYLTTNNGNFITYGE
jgi:hypothetical protein